MSIHVANVKTKSNLGFGTFIKKGAPLWVDTFRTYSNIKKKIPKVAYG